MDIAVSSAGGFANSAAQDAFCAGTTCVITIVYDQSGRGNHLEYQGPGSLPGGKDDPTGEMARGRASRPAPRPRACTW
jgi:hypothetical protein